MRIIWVDLETGGVNSAEHQITQMAAIATGGPPLFKEVEEGTFERKASLVAGKWTREALEIQAFDPEVWKEEAVPMVQVLDDFDDWVGQFCHEAISKRTGKPYRVAHMAGHNVAFDGRFLRAAAERNDRWIRLTNWTGGMYDTLHLAKWYFLLYENKESIPIEPPADLKLGTLCEFFKIQVETSHDALEDVRATIKIAREMIL